MPTPQEKRDKLVEQMKECYERLFATDDGKRVLRDITLSGGIGRSAFNSDPLIMAHSVAKQDLANHIVWMATPEEKKEEAPKEAIK
jgi:hypothetical protein